MLTELGNLRSIPVRLHTSESTGGDYTEGNAWQYTWHVQHDVPGLDRVIWRRTTIPEQIGFFVHLETGNHPGRCYRPDRSICTRQRTQSSHYLFIYVGRPPRTYPGTDP
ncbi:MAG: glycoside hydrolase domain-containing protein [Phocaeicola vulgatus]